MKIKQKKGESDWGGALLDAVGGPEVQDRRIELFLEDREHLSVELNGSVGRPVASGSRIRGLAARSQTNPERIVHCSDPGLEHADRLVGALLHENPASELERDRRTGSVEGHDRESLDPRRGGVLLERLLGRIASRKPRILVRGRWTGLRQDIRFASHGAGLVGDRRQGERIHLETTLESEKNRAPTVGEAVLGGAEVDLADLDRLADQVAERAERRLDAEDVGCGREPVVFAPGVGGVLVHEIVGHALEADTILEGGSWLSSGRDDHAVVASRGLSVLDDPRRGRVAWEFDDEGHRSGPLALIRDGRVIGQLHDAQSARQAAARSSGHGRCSSYREPVRPRMGCTFVAPGRHDPAEVLEGIESGLYVRRMERATTDAITGRAIFRVSDADRIRNGRIDVPLQSFMLVVRGEEAISSIDRVAADLRFDPCIGSCVKHGQALSISVGAPTFRIGVTAFYS